MTIPITNIVIGVTARPMIGMLAIAVLGFGLLRGNRWIRWLVGALSATICCFGGYNLITGWSDTHPIDRWTGAHLLVVFAFVAIVMLLSPSAGTYMTIARRALRIRRAGPKKQRLT